MGMRSIEIAQHTPGKHRWGLWPLVDHRVGPIPFFVFRLRCKGMPVGNQHLALLQQGPVFDWHEVKGRVIVLRPLWSQHLQPFLDGQVRATDQHGMRKFLALGIHATITERPGNEHSHDYRFARSSGHFTAQTTQGDQGRIRWDIDQRREIVRLLPGVNVGCVPCISCRKSSSETSKFRKPVRLDLPEGAVQLDEVVDSFNRFTLAEEQAS